MLKKILYVEDDDSISEIVQLVLVELGGFVVETCSSGIEALEALDWFRPDLIILDVMMPGMDGVQTLEQMQRENLLSGVPVVFMTAKVQPQEQSRYLQAGGAGVISKPFDPMKLVSQLTAIWEDSWKVERKRAGYVS